jgi:colicin import membrane protein
LQSSERCGRSRDTETAVRAATDGAELKTYQTSIGFFDLAVAAPSMKAALEIWGADSNVFHQGFAKEADDPAVVAATLELPGVLLTVGTTGAFKETAELPNGLASGSARPASREKETTSPRSRASSMPNSANARAAAAAFEKQRRKREAAQQREDLARSNQRKQKAVRFAEAQDVLDAALKEHDSRNAAIQAERDELEKRAKSEDERWQKQREKMLSALRRAKASD